MTQICVLLTAMMAVTLAGCDTPGSSRRFAENDSGTASRDSNPSPKADSATDGSPDGSDGTVSVDGFVDGSTDGVVNDGSEGSDSPDGQDGSDETDTADLTDTTDGSNADDGSDVSDGSEECFVPPPYLIPTGTELRAPLTVTTTAKGKPAVRFECDGFNGILEGCHPPYKAKNDFDAWTILDRVSETEWTLSVVVEGYAPDVYTFEVP